MNSDRPVREAWRLRWQREDASAFEARSHSSGRLEAITRLSTIAASRVWTPAAISIDVGCGTGLFAAASDARQIIGVDVSAPMLQLARKRMNCVCQQDLFNLALRPDSVDNLICAFVLDDYPPEDKILFIHSVRRLLRRGGHCFVAAYSPVDYHMGRRRGESELPVYLETQEAYVALFVRAGFKVLHDETIETSGHLTDTEAAPLDRAFIVLAAMRGQKA